MRESLIQRELRTARPGTVVVDKTPPFVLYVRDQIEVLFVKGVPWAMTDGGDVSFPDLPMPSSIRAQINAWHSGLPQTRYDPEDFDYMVTAALMRSLRPLLRVPKNDNASEQHATDPFRGARTASVLRTTAGKEESSGPTG